VKNKIWVESGSEETIISTPSNPTTQPAPQPRADFRKTSPSLVGFLGRGPPHAKRDRRPECQPGCKLARVALGRVRVHAWACRVRVGCAQQGRAAARIRPGAGSTYTRIILSSLAKLAWRCAAHAHALLAYARD